MSKPMSSMKFAAASATAILIGIGAALAAGEAPQTFATPKQGFDALVGAVRAHDRQTLSAILGPEGDSIVSSGDAQADRIAGDAFISEYDARNRIGQTSGRAILNVGNDDWPLPIPMVKSKAGWQFDAASGKEELLARRIGRNELYTVQACLAYVDAQRDYNMADRGDGMLTYAQRFISTPNKKDGLYWQTAAGQPESPLGPVFAAAQARGYDGTAAREAGVNGQTPFNGYYFRILTSQGPGAKGGAYNYIVNGKMIGGFAMVAYPVQYGNSGIMTFIVNHDGVVYQKNLGPSTAMIAEGMKAFNPDKSWTKAGSTNG